MAKIRRVMRKLARPDRSFDEQLWPVFLALLVFGGCLVGMVLAASPWRDRYDVLLAVLSIVGIVVLVGGSAVLLAVFNNRIANRRTLLALIISLIVNFVFLFSTRFWDWVPPFELTFTSGLQAEHEPRVIPEYFDFQVNPQDHPKQDFQKHVETEDPEIQQKEIERQQPEESKPKPDKVEVPKPPEDTPEPNAVERQVVAQTAPRQSEQPSKLSRQTIKHQPHAARPAASVKVDSPAQQRNQPQPQSADVAQRRNSAAAARQPAQEEPATPTDAQQQKILRRRDEQQQVAQDVSAPTLPRRMEQPRTIPRTTDVAKQVNAPVPRQTSPDQIKPNTTETQKQRTTSPLADAPTRPTPDAPEEIAQAKPLQRRNVAAIMPEQARAPRAVPNRHAPTVTLPSDASAAALADNAAAQQSPRAALQPRDSNLARRPAENANSSRTPQSADAPDSPRAEQIAQASTQRAQSSRVPTANPQAAPLPSPSRAPAASVANIAVSANAVRAPAAQPNQPTNAPQAAGVQVSKRQTSTDAPARIASETAPQTPSLVSEVASTIQARQQMAQDAPVNASTPAPSPRRLAAVASNPSPTEIAAATASATASPVRSDSPSPAPSSSAVSRQVAQTATQSNSPRAMDAPTQSPATQLARARTNRATTSDVPTIHPAARPTGAPSRSANTADLAASPAATAAPAASASQRSTSNPAAEPSRLALTKSFGGTAGMGRSSNMDRNAPAPESVAATPSGSVRRAEPTQQADVGPQLSPSAPARIARTRAGQNAPSATLAAREVDNARVAGAEQSTELTASASAALQSRRSDAIAGEVTAAVGDVEFDTGPTKVVSENSTGKASGGGQPDLNFETRSHKLARSEVGGAPEVTLAEAEPAKTAAAPDGDGGGEPLTPEASPEAVALLRTEQGGQSPATGGPASLASDTTAESASAQQVAAAKVGRAEAIEAAKGQPVAGGGSRSPARNATGPKLLNNLIAAAAKPTDGANPPAGRPDGSPPAPAETQLARADASGGTPTAGGPSKSNAVGPPEDETGQASNLEAALAEAGAARATAIDAAVGNPAAGGGTGSPRRQVAAGPAFAANAKAERVELAGAPTSSGEPKGETIEAQGSQPQRLAAGARGAAADELAGALAGDRIMDAPNTGEAGAAPGRSKTSPSSENGPQISELANRGGPFKKAARFAPSAGSATEVAMADVGGSASVEGEEDIEAMMSGMDSAGMSHQVAGGLTVEVSAPEGPGGLGSEVALDAGTMSRRAQVESQEVHFREARFIRSRSGGPLSINVVADIGTKAFAGRSKFKNAGLTGEGGENVRPPAEKSIELGLQFLANHQSGDGSWSLNDFGGGRRGYENETTILRSNVSATGLCLLSFLGAGYHHQDGDYKEVVAGGINYLVKNQKPSGDLFVEQDPESARSMRFYSHGIAAIALCEAYGMTQDANLREPAQKAIDFIVNTQNKDRGGWRYSANQGSDTSVTGWQMMALQSGRLAGLDAPDETFQRIDKWLKFAQAKGSSHQYVYNPLASTKLQPLKDAQGRPVFDRNGKQVMMDQSKGRLPNRTMTSVGLLMQLYAGQKRDDADMIAGARYLMQHLPTNGTRLNNERDTYYWYYATQVMFHMGGDFWETWNERLHPLLIDGQVQTGPMAGSWDPRRPVPDRWAAHAGRIYVTTLNILSLEVAYRHLPIYDDSVK